MLLPSHNNLSGLRNVSLFKQKKSSTRDKIIYPTHKEAGPCKHIIKLWSNTIIKIYVWFINFLE